MFRSGPVRLTGVMEHEETELSEGLPYARSMIGTTYGRPNIIQSDPNDNKTYSLHQAIEQIEHSLAYPVDIGVINNTDRMYSIINKAYRLLYAPDRTLTDSSFDSKRISAIILLDGQIEEWLAGLPFPLQVTRSVTSELRSADDQGHEKAFLQLM